MKSRKLSFQSLEEKRLMAADALQLGGTLFLRGDNADNVMVVDQIEGTRSVTVTLDGEVERFDNVMRVLARGGNGDDEITINTFDNPAFLIRSVVRGDNGNDILQGGGGNDVLDGGNGDDIITNFVTGPNYEPVGSGSVDILIGGNGNDSLWGGWGRLDMILGGNGDDTIYDIVGGRNHIVGGQGDDFITARGGAGLPTDPLNNPGGLVSDAVFTDRQDSRVVLFDAATQAAGPVVIGSTLYLLNLDGGEIIVDDSGDRLLVSYDGEIFEFDSKGITAVASIMGPTDDLFINNSAISAVVYGQGGSDTIIGGFGDDLLKGGDGDDVIIAGEGFDDITGDAGSDILIADDDDKDIVRNDPRDAIFTDIGRDRIVTKRNLRFA